MKVYLDYAATTPVDEKIFRAMKPYYQQKFGNPSSVHSFGQEGRAAIDESKEKIARILNCNSQEIIFISGGSEADNLILRGITAAAKNSGFKPHIITTRIEHKAILETAKILEKNGAAEVSYVNVNKSGQINPQKIISEIRENTVLVSIMYVNNETGVINPIREIGKRIEKINLKRQKQKKSKKIYFHSDAVQAAQYLPIDTKYLHLDAMTLSAHKIYGPKGIGLLYLKEGTLITPQITGGMQEEGRRAGTENVAYIVGMAKALEMAQKNRERVSKKVENLRYYLENEITNNIEKTKINGSRNRAPHISNISFKGAEGESIILALDLEGVAVSSGSACTSSSLKPSHVLLAMGVKPLDAQSSIRFSLGKKTTAKELDYTVKKLIKIINRLRNISPI